MEKNLEYFQQQVFKNVEYNQLYQHQINKMNNEAAELYAEHRAQEAIAKISTPFFQLEEAEKKGWNEGLHWAVKNVKIKKAVNFDIDVIDKESILKGLK